MHDLFLSSGIFRVIIIPINFGHGITAAGHFAKRDSMICYSLLFFHHFFLRLRAFENFAGGLTPDNCLRSGSGVGATGSCSSGFTAGNFVVLNALSIWLIIPAISWYGSISS